MIGRLAQVHEDLVFNTPGGIGSQLDVLFRVEGIDRLDQSDGADGDQILQIDAGIVEPPGQIDHKAEVVLDQGVSRLPVSVPDPKQQRPLRLPVQRGRQDIAASNVVEPLCPAETAFQAAQRQFQPCF